MSDLILAQNPTKTQAASKWLALGGTLLPCQSGSKHLIKGFGPHRAAICDAAGVKEYFSDHGYNMAVLLPVNLWCLDFDDDALFSRWEAATPPELLDTYAESSPRGFHYFYRMALPAVLRFVKGVEVKKHCLVAPSEIAGFRYTPVNGQAPVLKIDDYISVLSPLLSESKPITGFKPSQAEEVRKDPVGPDVVSKIKAAWTVRKLAYTLTQLKASPAGQARYWVGRCPIHHPDEHPSFWVDDELNIFGCHACNVTGDVINLFALVHEVSNNEAIRQLAQGLPR